MCCSDISEGHPITCGAIRYIIKVSTERRYREIIIIIVLVIGIISIFYVLKREVKLEREGKEMKKEIKTLKKRYRNV